jgi:biopolymer transport protein ExbD
MAAAAKIQPQPEVHLRADGDVAYRRVAQVMSDAAKVGLTRIGFVTDPSLQQ